MPAGLWAVEIGWRSFVGTDRLRCIGTREAEVGHHPGEERHRSEERFKFRDASR